MSSPYLSLTDADRDAMLATIGVGSVDDLFGDIPEGVRLRRELAIESNRRGDVLEELAERIDSDRREHRLAVGLRQGEVRHWSASCAR